MATFASGVGLVGPFPTEGCVLRRISMGGSEEAERVQVDRFCSDKLIREGMCG